MVWQGSTGSSSTDRRLGLSGGVAVKVPCKAATTVTITLSGEQTIDGVSCTSGDRVLVKSQTTATDNGIYVCDTGNWVRDLDFDGANDVVQGTQVYVVSGTVNGGGMFAVTTANPVLPGTSAIAFLRGTQGTVTHSSVTATTGQTVVSVPTYQIGANSLEVYADRIRQIITTDYTETSSTSITFTSSLIAGTIIDLYSRQPTATLTANPATSVTISDAGDFYVATTVEGALQEVAQGITADNGDADATLINTSSDRIQCWNTAFTSNHTVTLSTSNAKEGATFYVIRGAGATGNYTLAVGTLATLRAPGEWCRVSYDEGTAAWVLVEYGILPSAEIRATSVDNGDASATLTVATSARTQRWATALTADRTATLSATGAYSGARFRIVRQETATGNFALVVSDGTNTLTRLAVGQAAEVEYTGTAWVLVKVSNLRESNTNLIVLRDDFNGFEVNGYLWNSLIGTDSSARQFTVYAEQLRGIAKGTTGASASATMAVNGVQINSQLNWQATQGCLSIEFRLDMDAITNVCVFAGFTDQDSALEMPINGAGGGNTFTNNATDAVGVLFDTTMTTKNWWLTGVANGTGATGQNSAVAPVASTMETWRIDLSATGVATFYRNGTAIGTAMTGAVTAATPLTPVIAAFARGAASRNIAADFVSVQGQR